MLLAVIGWGLGGGVINTITRKRETNMKFMSGILFELVELFRQSFFGKRALEKGTIII